VRPCRNSVCQPLVGSPHPRPPICAFVADPAGHVRIDGSGTLNPAPDAPPITEAGRTFAMHMDRTPLGDIPGLTKCSVRNTVTQVQHRSARGQRGRSPRQHVSRPPADTMSRLEMARRSRGSRRLVGLVAHADAGSQFTSVRFTERLDEIGARPSIGTVADSFDNALAETTNGLYKAECVRGPNAPPVWDDVDQLELETLSWVHWFNEHRLHGHCDDVPPAEHEAAFYAAQRTDPTGVGIQ
jgi:transposase InsO family protein